MTFSAVLLHTPAVAASYSRVPLTQEDQIFLAYLKGAAICLIQRGHDHTVVIRDMYQWLDDNNIRHPEPGDPLNEKLWKEGYKLYSRPGFCKSVLDPQPVFDI